MLARAQTATPESFRLSGTVADTAGIGLAGATIQMTIGVDTVTIVSKDRGLFEFANVRSSKFRLLVTMRGFTQFGEDYTVDGRKSVVVLPLIRLRARYSDLDPVTVTGVRPVVIRGDTVSFNVAAFPVPEGSEIEDVLKRLPGVELDMNGNVTVQGKLVSRVLVNGKEFFGGDVLLAIRNLPASIVAKLQIVDDYGDKARLTGIRSGQSTKLLNIVLKDDTRRGEFGQVTGTAGSGQPSRYESSAFGNGFSGDRRLSVIANVADNNPSGSDFATRFGMDFADQLSPRWEGVFNANRSTEAPNSTGSSESVSYFPSEIVKHGSSSRNNNFNVNNSLNVRLSYKPNSISTIRLILGTFIGGAMAQVSNQFSDLQQGNGYSKSTNGQSLMVMRSSNRGVNSSLYYEWQSTKTRQRLSVEGTIGYSAIDQSTAQQSAATVRVDSVFTNTVTNIISNSPSSSLNWQMNTNYFMPLGVKGFLELGWRMQSSAGFNKVETRMPDSLTGISEIVDSLSTNLKFQTVTNDFHMGYTAKVSRFDLSAILDLQPGLERGTVNTKGDVIGYRYFAVSPVAELAWNLSVTKKMNFAWSSQPTLPTIQEISPYTNVTNPQYPVTGNPGLRPAYTNITSWRYEETRLHGSRYFSFGVGLSYFETRHVITQSLTTPRDSSQVVEHASWINDGNIHGISGDYHLMFPGLFNNRLRIHYSGAVSSQGTITVLDSVRNPTRSVVWSQRLHIQLLVQDRCELELAGTYSQSRANYSGSSSLPALFRSASVNWSSRYYLLSSWILGSQLSQLYASSGNGLVATPAMVNASLQRQFLSHKMATITLSSYNLFNAPAAVAQSNSITTSVQTRPSLSGRYFLLSVAIKLQRF